MRLFCFVKMLPLLRLDPKIYTWIIIGALAIPEYITEDMIALAKTALTKSPLTPIFRDIVRRICIPNIRIQSLPFLCEEEELVINDL
jgi:hypothetical protein